MIAGWMIYALIVGALVATGASAVERVARLLGRSGRWIWALALLITLTLSARAAFQTPRPTATGPAIIATTVAGNDAPPRWTWRMAAVATARTVARATLDAPSSLQSAATRALPGLGNSYVIALWAMASSLLALCAVFVHRRFGRARAAWPHATVDGVSVRVSPRVGPVVLGVVRPEVVLPRWLLQRGPADQKLVVLHESEHVRARDPLLLAAGWVAAVLAPWHAVVWYMLSRLRLAIELDCDGRVLRRGAAPASYGALLIEVAERAMPLHSGVLALADDSSHLYRRIRAMGSRRPKFAVARGAAGVAFGLLALLVACEAKLPTPAQRSSDAASAQSTARPIGQQASFAKTDSTRYLIDGVEATPLQARTLDPDAVDSMAVIKSGTGGPTVAIKLKHPSNPSVGLRAMAPINVPPRIKPAVDSLGIINVVVRSASDGPLAIRQPSDSGRIVYFLNGVETDSATVRNLDRETILSVEVIKGPLARTLYNVSEARGIIVIRTKG